MLLHKKYNQRLFLEKRLVFEGPDSAKADKWSQEALPQAVDAMKGAGDVLAAANAWIDGQTIKDMDPKDLEATKKLAKEKLKANSAELQKAKSFITAKTTMLAQEEILKTPDIWVIGATMKKLQSMAPALDYRPDDEATKSYKKYNDDFKVKAKALYDGMKAPGEGGITTPADAQKYLSTLATMQKAKMEGFPGLDDKTETEERFKKDAAAIITAIEAGGETVIGDAEIKRQLEMYKFAAGNYDAAAAEAGNEGHDAGAKQYMDMVYAEQEARAIWSQLSKKETVGASWRKDSLDKDAVLPGNAWKRGELVEIYNQAIKSFQDAKGKADKAKGSGRPDEAIALFKIASAKFGELLALQQSEDTTAEDAAKQAKEKEEGELKAAMEGYNKKLDEFNKTYNNIVNGPAIVQKHVKQYVEKDLGAAKASADKGDYKAATEAVSALATKVDKDLSDYKSFISKGKTVIGNAIGQMASGGNYADAGKQERINNFLNNPGTFTGIPAWLKSQRGEVKVSGQWVYDSTDSKQLYGIQGNLYGVTVTDKDTEGNNVQTANTYGTSRITVEAPQGGFANTVNVETFKHETPVKKSEKDPDVAAKA